MKDFASFTGNGAGEDFVAEAIRIANGYDGAGESELLRTIYARAVEGKRNGTLSNEEIDAFYRQFSPMLDAAKRKKLQKIVNDLKRM